MQQHLRPSLRLAGASPDPQRKKENSSVNSSLHSKLDVEASEIITSHVSKFQLSKR